MRNLDDKREQEIGRRRRKLVFVFLATTTCAALLFLTGAGNTAGPGISPSSASRTGGSARLNSPAPNPAAPQVAQTPTFGHPVISGIGGNGFEQDIRLDPTDPNRVYTSSPGALSSDTSWIWHSR